MPDWKTLSRVIALWGARNRGIGAATVGEITVRFDIAGPGSVLRAIIYHAGENDIAFGVSRLRAAGRAAFRCS